MIQVKQINLFAPASWSVPAWYVDPSNVTGHASNANDGVTAVTPLLTVAEIYRRWGTLAPILPQDTTINILSDQPDFTDPIVLDLVTVAAVSGFGVLTVVGTPIQVGSGAFSSVTSKNRATAQRWNVTDLAQNWAPLVNTLVNDTTAGAWFWVDADLGGGSAVVTEPMQAGSPSNPAPAEVTISPGDAYIVYRMPKVYMPSFTPTDATGVTSTLWHLNFTGPVGSFGFLGGTIVGSVQVIECRVDTFLTNSTSSGDFLSTNSSFPGGVSLNEGDLVGGSVGFEFSAELGSQVYLDGDIAINANVVSVEGVVSVGLAYFANELDLPNLNSVGGIAQITVAPNNYATAAFWGPSVLKVYPGGDLLLGAGLTFVATFLQLGGIFLDGATTASSYNLTTGAWVPGVALTPANLDATVLAGGFGGVAYGNSGSKIRLITP